MGEPSVWSGAMHDAEAVTCHFLRTLSVEPPLSDTALYRHATSLFVLRELYRMWQATPSRHVVCTERDLYYRAPQLFGQSGQRAVQAALARLTVWLAQAPTSPPERGHSREALGVMAVAKARLVGRLVATVHRDAAGMVSSPGPDGAGGGAFWELGGLTGLPVSWLLVGDPRVRWHFDGRLSRAHVVDVVHRSGQTLSILERSVHHALCEALSSLPPEMPGAPLALILVEKECVLHALMHGPLGACLAQTCLVLSTRGYPCVATRHLVRCLHTRWPSMPLLQLVDGDPHGLAILLVMMGLALTESATAARAAPSPPLVPLVWVGLKPSTLTDSTPAARGEGGGGVSLSLSAAARQAAGAPLTPTDLALLARLERLVRAALAAAESVESAASMQQTLDGRISTRCLASVYEEIGFLTRSRVKYELEAAQSV